MIPFTNQLYERLRTGLEEIRQIPDTDLRLAGQSYQLCYECLKELKQFMASYSFSGPEEEIRFFKEIKPRFLRQLLLQLQIFKAESDKPEGNPEALKSYYEQVKARQYDYLDQNKTLYLYYKLEKTHLDPKLFTRQPEDVLLLPQYDLESDGAFSNAYSFKLAKLQAAEDFIVWLQLQLHKDLAGDQQKDQGHAGKPGLVWRGTQAQFYEWLFGAVKTGALGEVSLKRAIEWLGACLGIQPEHYYRHFQAMRIRKKTRTPYLEKCIAAVTAWMDEADEHPHYH